MSIVESRRSGFPASLAVIVAVTAAFALIARAGHGLTVDEPFMANSVRLPWPDLLSVFRTDNVPFAYLLLKGWTALFGESELALRTLSTVAYAGAVVLVGLAGRAVQGPTAGLVAASLMATSASIGIVHAATARPYALLALMTAAAAAQCVALLRAPAMPRPELRWRTAALATTHLLGLWTHPTYAFIVIAAAAASAGVRRRIATPEAIASGLAAVAWLALWGAVLWATIALQPTSWMQPPRFRDLQAAFLLLWGTGPGFMLAGALLAAGLSNRSRLRECLSAPPMRWLCLAAALAWLMPVLASVWKPVFIGSRTPVMLLPLTALVAGVALAAVSSRLALLVLAAFLTLGAAHRIAAGRLGDPVPTRASVAAVLERARCGDTLLAAGLAHAPVEYYLRRLSAPACVRFERFPTDMVNWTGRMAQPEAVSHVEGEARDLAARLASRGGRVWLFTLSRGIGTEASEMLESRFRGSMACGRLLPLRGAFFDRVVRCEGR